MTDGINFLQQIVALQAQEASEDSGAPRVLAVEPPVQAVPPRDMGKTVQSLVDDLMRAAKADGRDGRLVDAVIEKFCNDQFALNGAKGDQVERMLKATIHSAMQGGLTRGETLAAISQTGEAVKGGGPVPAELYVAAGRVAGNESHQAIGIAQLMAEMDGANSPRPAVAATSPDAGASVTRSDVAARYDQALSVIAQNIK